MELKGDGADRFVHAPEAGEQEAAREAIRALARPRLTGTPEADAAATELRGRLSALGYEIRELPFRFSTIPGRFGVPAAGLAYVIGVLLTAWLLAAARPGFALFTAALTGGLLSLGAASARPAIARLPLGRTTATNWLVQRAGARPRYLVVAHRDSKSQLVPLLVRVVAVGFAIAALAGLILLSLAGILNAAAIMRTGGWLLAGVGALAGVALLLSWAGNASPGALDNASGLAVLLGLAARERERDDVAFLVTDAEELGLAGAMAAIPDLPPIFGVIVLDGIDDAGEFQIMERFGIPRRGLAPHLAAALLGAATALGLEAHRRTLPLGMMVEHTVFTDAGLPALTLMRGSAASLWRVHGRGDSADRLQGTGAASAVALVAGALELLRQPKEPTPHVLPDGLAIR
jgi:hypothetical protein